MSSPTLFYISLLELIPRFPKSITVSEIITKLEEINSTEVKNDKDRKAEIRKVERALETLHLELNQIECDTTGRAYKYSWSAAYEPMIFPSLDSNTALVLALASQYLEPIIPETSFKALNRLFIRAKTRLASKVSNEVDKVSIWRDKVAILNSGMPRIIPRLNHKIESIIYDALLNESVVKIRYQAWGKNAAEIHTLSPQGLFVKGQFVYIFAVNHKYKDKLLPFSYLLLRVQDAELVDDLFIKIPGFKTQAHLDAGAFGVPLDKAIPKISLHIKLDKEPLRGVEESPLSEDQKITKAEELEKWSSLTATVSYTLELKQWLRSHAHHIEVIEPQDLREEFKTSIKEMFDTYKG